MQQGFIVMIYFKISKSNRLRAINLIIFEASYIIAFKSGIYWTIDLTSVCWHLGCHEILWKFLTTTVPFILHGPICWISYRHHQLMLWMTIILTIWSVLQWVMIPVIEYCKKMGHHFYISATFVSLLCKKFDDTGNCMIGPIDNLIPGSPDFRSMFFVAKCRFMTKFGFVLGTGGGEIRS